MRLLKIGICLLSILFIGSKANAEEIIGITPYLEKVFEIDECEQPSKKEVFVLLKIGEVSRLDSLFGFDLEIKYDPTKINFINVVTQNTMSEFFEIKSFTILSSDSLIYGTAGHVNPYLPPYEGELPLVGLFGYWLGDCGDTSEISISYINFFDEFKKEVSSYKSVKIYSSVLEKPNRVLEYTFDRDSASFVSDSSITLNIVIDKNGNRLTSNTFFIDIDSDEFAIEEVFTDSENIQIVDYEESSSGVYKLNLNFTENFTEDTLKVKLSNKGSIGEHSGRLKIVPESVGLCDCITQYVSNEVVLSSKIEDNTSAVKDEGTKTAFFSKACNCFEIRTSSDLYKKILIYDIYGKIVYQEDTSNDIVRIDAERYANGVYIIVVDKQDTKQIMNLIKY